jgi:predicted HTH domain antitoxin
MKILNLEIPDTLEIRDAKIIFAGELYERSILSLGQAARVAGLSKRAFIEIIGKYGFSIFSQSEEDLREDIQNA